MLVQSFPPCIDSDAKILILGSMPGRISLTEQRYYAHPRNQFWWIVSEIFNDSMPREYQERLGWLKSHKVGLWDVLKFCEREGSLDANIKKATEVVNPLAELIQGMERLQLVIFNGKKAEQVFRRFFSSEVNVDHIQFVCLPSTSPANAAMTKEQKLEKWSSVIVGQH